MPSSRPAGWSLPCSTSRRTSSRPFARKRPPRFLRRPRARPRARGPGGGRPGAPSPGGGQVRRRPAGLPREDAGELCALVPPAPRSSCPPPGDPGLGLLPPAGEPGLPEPGRDRTDQPGAAGGARRPAGDPPAAGGVPPDRPPHDVPAGARRDALLPVVPRAGEGFLFQGVLRRKDGLVAEKPAGHRPQGLPAGRKDLGDARAAPGGRLHRRARPGLHRQPDVSRDRPPHLQRLHEGVHLPEAGAGRHPPDRDRGPDRRSGAAVGRGDLRLDDPLEPAQPGSSPRAPLRRQEGAGRGTGPRRLHPGALPPQRGLRRRRHRRAQTRESPRPGPVDPRARCATHGGARRRYAARRSGVPPGLRRQAAGTRPSSRPWRTSIGIGGRPR